MRCYLNSETSISHRLLMTSNGVIEGRNLLFLVGLITSVAGCHALLDPPPNMINYALSIEVQCTSPEMIDGNRETAGECVGFTNRNVFNRRMATPGRYYGEAIVTLPERKRIRKIAIYSADTPDELQIMAKDRSGGWSPIKAFKGKTVAKAYVVKKQIVTNSIKIKMEQGFASTSTLDEMKTLRRFRIQEIELWGYPTE
jgi:hypothetical protein